MDEDLATTRQEAFGDNKYLTCKVCGAVIGAVEAVLVEDAEVGLVLSQQAELCALCLQQLRKGELLPPDMEE